MRGLRGAKHCGQHCVRNILENTVFGECVGTLMFWHASLKMCSRTNKPFISSVCVQVLRRLRPTYTCLQSASPQSRGAHWRTANKFDAAFATFPAQHFSLCAACPVPCPVVALVFGRAKPAGKPKLLGISLGYLYQLFGYFQN